MKFFLLSFGVLCGHLVLIGWWGLGSPGQPDRAPPPVQTRQILEPSPLQKLAALSTQPHVDQRPPAAKPVSKRTEPTPLAQTDQPKLKPDSNINHPLPTGVGAELALPANANSADSAVNPVTDVGGAVKNTASSGVHLPSSQADYLNNPQPPYPSLSLRLRESGKVVVRVLIGKNGQALRGELVQSSGFERLDQSALRAVLAWRYVPGKVDGQAQDMWFDVPISFRLPN